jgi:hypothetical protein
VFGKARKAEMLWARERWVVGTSTMVVDSWQMRKYKRGFTVANLEATSKDDRGLSEVPSAAQVHRI